MGNPDTIVLDPLITYKLKIQTIPPVEVDSIKVSPGKHSIIAAKTPQGTLVVTPKGGNQYRDMRFIVRKNGTMKTLNYQTVSRPERYITGLYDLEIPTLPKIILEDIEIKQSHTTKVEIPTPGIVTFLKTSKGYGSLYVLKGKKQEWVCRLDPNAENESMILQPGYYRVVYRAKNAKETIYTIKKTFEITSGSSKPVNLF
jgi:Ca-activated chloride channel family protein